MTQETKVGSKWVEKSSGIVVIWNERYELEVVGSQCLDLSRDDYGYQDWSPSLEGFNQHFTPLPSTKDELVKEIERIGNCQWKEKYLIFENLALPQYYNIIFQGKLGWFIKLPLNITKQLTPYLDTLGEILRKEQENE